MKFLGEIKNKDIFPGTTDLFEFFNKYREAVRIVAFDDSDKIAILYSKKYNYYSLPGGGIEEGESSIDAAHREAKEETGCNISNLQKVGYVVQHGRKVDLTQKEYCFLAKVHGEKGVVDFTDEEFGEDYEVQWINIDSFVQKMEKQRASFLRTRDLIFISEVTKIMDK